MIFSTIGNGLSEGVFDFDACDSNHDQKLTKKELRDSWDEDGSGWLSMHEAKRAGFDVNKDGKVDVNEMYDAVQFIKEADQRFDNIDKNSGKTREEKTDGVITRDAYLTYNENPGE